MHNLLTSFLFFYFLGIISLTASTRTLQDTLPPVDSLMSSLQTYHQEQLQAQLAEFQVSEKGAWLKYIPAIGLGYSLGTDQAGNLRNVLRPSVSYSTNVIYQVRQDRELKRAKVEAIKRAAVLALENDRRELKLMLQRYESEVAELAFMEQLNAIDTELYEIATVQFTAAEIPPSSYLPKKRIFLQKQFEIFQKRKQIKNLVAELLLIARYDL